MDTAREQKGMPARRGPNRKSMGGNCQLAGQEKKVGGCDDSSQISKRTGDNAPNRGIPATVQPCRKSGQEGSGVVMVVMKMRMLSNRRKEEGKGREERHEEKGKERKNRL